MVLADRFEAAREAAPRLVVRYQRQPPSATFGSSGLVEQRPADLLPERKNPGLGNADAALRNLALLYLPSFTLMEQVQ